jgi:Kef-type K+ transport system membrane component KefB
VSTDAVTASVVAATACILAVSAGFGALARRFRQPPVIGQIVAGIALGPSLLGQLPGNPTQVLFPTEIRPFLTVVGQVALTFFLFAVGYELDLRLLRQRHRVVSTVALAGLLIPALLGAGSAFAFGPVYRAVGGGTGHAPASFVVFVAVALTITAVPVLASILAERDLIGTFAGVVAMTSAAIIDVAGWLALVAALLTTSDAGPGWLLTLLLFAGYLLAMLLLVRPALRWSVKSRLGGSAAAPSLVMALALGSAFVTARLGLHVIFGALLAGMVMPRDPTGSPYIRLLRPMREFGALLLPVFFVVAGLSVDLVGLGAAGLLLFVLVCLTAMVSKIGAGGLAARISGLSWRDSVLVGVLLNTRGLTELIVLNVGLTAGIINDRLYTVFVLMALVTTVVTSPLADRLRPVATRPQTETVDGYQPDPAAGPIAQSAPAVPTEIVTARVGVTPAE